MIALVTGDTGFIGSNMKQFLIKQGVEVQGYSRRNGFDILNLNQLCKRAKNCDLVFHFVAEAKPAESVLNPVRTIEVNLKGCLNILETCRELHIPLIYPSSCEIYGDSTAPITENFPLNPPNPYSASKAAADRICYTYYKSYGVDVKIIRLFNPYGPHQQLNKIIPVLYRQAIHNQPITVYGDGTDTRDYVYVDDIVRGLWLSRSAPSGDAINFATGRATTNLQMANRIKEMVGSKSQIVMIDYPKPFGGIKSQVGSHEKAKMLLKWEPQVTLEDGLKQTVEWLSKKNEVIK